MGFKRVNREPRPDGTFPPFRDCPSCGDPYDASIWHVEVVDFCGHIKCNACAMDYRFDCQECVKEKKKAYVIQYPADYPEYLRLTHGDLEMGEEAWMEKVRKINPIFRDWKRIPIRIKDAAILYPQPEPPPTGSDEDNDSDVVEIDPDEDDVQVDMEERAGNGTVDTEEESGNGTPETIDIEENSVNGTEDTEMVGLNKTSNECIDGEVAGPSWGINNPAVTAPVVTSTSTSPGDAAPHEDEDDDDSVRLIKIIDMSKITEEEDEEDILSSVGIPPPPSQNVPFRPPLPSQNVPFRPPPRQPPPSKQQSSLHRVPPPHCLDPKLSGECFVKLTRVEEMLTFLDGDDDDDVVVIEHELERVTRARARVQKQSTSDLKRVLLRKPESTKSDPTPSPKPGLPVPSKKLTRFECKACDVGFPTIEKYRSHNRTKSHKRKIAKFDA